jgi:hypothetical protein
MLACRRNPGSLAAFALGRGLLLWCFAAAACSDAAPRIGLTPTYGRNPACGHAVDGRLLLVTAQTGDREVTRSVPLDGSVASFDVADFPLDTRQITAEVIGAGGAVRAVGKSAPLEFATIVDGATVPIFMAPPGGGCEMAALQRPRRRAMIAAAGDGALIVGGGDQVSAEFFDATINQFVTVALPPAFANIPTLQGSALVTMPDGRVALFAAGTGAYALFDPATQQFGKPRVFEPRWQFAAVAVDATRVAIVGGCRSAVQGQCVGDAAANVLLVDIAADDVQVLGNLTTDHVGPDALLEPATVNRGATVLVVGGTTLAGFASTMAERMDLATGAVAMVATGGRAVSLDSGATLTGFASANAAATDTVGLLVPGTATVRSLTADRARRGPALALQEDGRVLIASGGASPSVFDPTFSTFSNLSAAGDVFAPQDELAMQRLADGSILLVGGAVGNVAVADAWRYRPSLIGPTTASVLLSAGLSNTSFTPLDSAEFALAANQFRLSGSSDEPTTFAVVGGPRRQVGSVQAVISVPAPTVGIAVAMHYRGPAQWLALVLRPGQPVTLVSREGAIAATMCTGAQLAANALATPVEMQMRIAGQTVTATLAGSEILRCSLAPALAATVGAVAVAGFGSGGAAAVSQLTVGPSGN